MTELFGGKMTFMQEGDGIIDVEINDHGGGKFFIIKTEKWEFDKIEELVAVLEKVKTAFEFKEK